MENYRELIEEKLDNVILQHSYSRNREKRVGSEYVEFIDWLVEELDRAREEGSFTIEELEVIRELCNFEYEKYVALDLEDSKEEWEALLVKLDKLSNKKE